MKTDQNSNMQGTLNKRISMKKRRNAKRALLALNLVAVIFTTTVFSNPVSVLSEEVSTDAVQSIENSPGTDAQIAEQADVQQNTAEAAQAVEAPAAEAPAAENSAEAAKAEEPSGVNAPAENAMSAEMNAAEDGVVSTDDGASSASAVQSADTSSASNGSFEDAGAGNTDGTKDGIIENDAEGLNEAEGTAANEESEDAASQEQLTYEDEHVKISVSYTDGRAFTADSILTRTYLDSDEKNAVLSAVNAQISKGNSADTVSDTAENTESSGSAPVASTTATTVEYSVAGFHALMLAAKNQDGSDTTTEGDVTFSAEFKKGLNDAGYASREETTENNEAGGDGSLTTTTTRCETSWKIYTVTEKNLTDITDITDAHNTHYEMDENGTLKSASFRGALPQTVAFVQIVKKTVTETTTQKETEKATEKETQKVTEKYTEKITGKAAEKTTETETEKEDVKAEVPASAAMPAVAFDQKVTTENGTVMVHIDAEEGAFEEGTSMTVTPVTRHDILDKAIDAAGGKGAAAAMDITFTKADGTKTEPLKPIHVKMISPVLNHAEEAHVVHVADSGTIDVVARKSDGKTIESTSSEAASSDAKNAVSFESDSFSVYAIVYTVDFETVDGGVYSVPGEGSYKLNDLLTYIIGKEGKVSDATLELVEGEEVEGALYLTQDEEKDWYINSDVAFDDTYELTMLVGNEKYVVKVTDENTSSSNLNDFIAKATIVADKEGDKYVLKPGKTYTASLRFKEDPDGFQFDDSGVLTYTLPDGFTPEGLNSGTFAITATSHGEDYPVEGNRYEVVGNQLKVYLNTESPNYQYVTSSSIATLDLNITGIFDQNKTQINWGGNVTTDIKFDTDAGVSVQKSITNFSAATGIVTYSVSIKALNGSSSDIVISDHMEGNHVDINHDVTLSGATMSSSGVSYNVVDWNNNTTGFSFTIPSMSAGQEATVTYTAKLKDGFDTWEGGNTFSAKPGGENKPDSDTKDLSHYIQRPSISKTSEVSDVVNGKQTITWTIVATSDDFMTLAGSTIKDEIRADSRSDMHYSGNGLTIVVTDANGSSQTRYPSWASVGVNNKNTDYSWTYNVPSSDTGDKTYVITYTTEVDVSNMASDVVMKNDVTEKYGGTEGKGTVGPEGDDHKATIDKSVVNVTAETITWKVELEVPVQGLTKARLTDYLPANTDKGLYDILNGSVDDIEIVGLDTANERVIRTYNAPDSANKKAGEIILNFQKNINGQWTDGLNGGTELRKITVTITSKNDQNWLEAAKSDGNLVRHTNNAKFRANDYDIDDSDSGSPMESSLTKKLNYSGTSDGLPVYYYQVLVTGVTGPFTIEDVFDSRLELFGNPEVKGGDQYSQEMKTSTPNPETDTSTDGKVIFTVSDSNLAKKGEGYQSHYRIEYALKVKDAEALASIKADAAATSNGIKVLTNTATSTLGEDHVDVEYKYNGLTKELVNESEVGVSTNICKFKLTVNPDGLDMNPEGDTITLNDVFSKTLSIDYKTISVEPRDGASWNVSGYETSFILPDETPIVITYDARIVGAGAIPFNNVATIGDQKAEYSDTKTVTADMGGTAGNFNVKILKHKRNELSTPLEGAVFELYYDKGDGVPGIPVTDDSNNTVTFRTRSDGLAFVEGNQHDDGWALREDVKYYLWEITPPDGYVLRDEATRTRYKFTIASSDIADYDNNIYHNGDTLHIGNTPLGGIEIRKSFRGAELSDDEKEKITFTITGPDGYNKTVSLSDFQDGKSYKITGLPVGDYSVVESNADVEGYTRTTSYYVGTDSTVEGESATVTLSNSTEEKVITYINKYQSDVEINPEDIQLRVQKKWYQGDEDKTNSGEYDDKSVEVQIERYRAELPTTVLHFYSEGSADQYCSDVSVPKGSTVSITVPGGANICAMTQNAYQWQEAYRINGGPQYVQNNGVYQFDTGNYAAVYIIINGNAGTLSVSYTGGSTSVPDDQFSLDTTYDGPTANLTNGNWGKTFLNLPVTEEVGTTKYIYKYLVKEISEINGFVTTYSVDGGEFKDNLSMTDAVNSSGQHNFVIKNKSESGALKLKKEVTVNNNSTGTKLADGEYEFTITGPDNTTKVNEKVTIKIVSGVATQYKLNNAETYTDLPSDKFVILPNLDPGVYEIEETTPSNGTVISKINGSDSTTYTTTVTVVAGDTTAVNASATFTNNISTGDLTVAKETSGTTAADANDTFTFTVALTAPENVTLASSYAARKSTDSADTTVTVTNNQITGITLKAGETFTIKGLPAGTGYTVTEADAVGYSKDIPNSTGTIANSANSTVTVTATNTRDKGRLQIKKTGTVNGNSDTEGLVNGNYTFTVAGVENSSTAGNTVTVEITLTSGSATAASKVGTSTPSDIAVSITDGVVTVSGLPTGQYTVSEDTTGLTAKGISVIGTNPQIITVEKEPQTLPTAEFKNNMDVGSLKITKVAKIGGSVASELNDSRKSLADGTYTFNVYSAYTDAETNTLATKADGTAVDDVTVDIKNGEIKSVAEVTNLLPGKYYVKETAGDNAAVTLDTTVYEVTVEGGKEGNTVASTAIAEATNTLPVGSLVVTKSVESTDSSRRIPGSTYTYPVTIKVKLAGKDYYVQNANGELGEAEPDSSLTVSCMVSSTGTLSNNSLTINNLPYGAYVVAETDPGSVAVAGFSFVESVSIVQAEATVSSENGSASLNNKYMPGASWTPVVTKHLNGAAYAGTEYSFELNEIGAGQHAPRTTNARATTDAKTGKATFSTISYHRPDLHGNEPRDFIYEIHEIVPSGSDRDEYIRYDDRTIYAKVTVSIVQGNRLEAVSGYYEDQDCTKLLSEAVFDNTELGNLTVTKTVTGSYTPNGDEFPITIKNEANKFLNASGELVDEDPELTVTAGKTLRFNKIPVGKYTVSEGSVTENGYEITTIYQVNSEVVTTAEATVTKGNIEAVGITNQYRDAELKITKTIDGITDSKKLADAIRKISFEIEDVTEGVESSDKTSGFTATITDADLSEGKYVKVFTSAVNGIKPDHKYKVTETVTAPDGYVLKSTTYAVSVGTADTGTTSTEGSLTLSNDYTSKGQIDFTNTYEEITSVKVKKTWNTNGAWPEGYTVEMTLKADGEVVETTAAGNGDVNPAELNSGKTETTWTNLPKNKADGFGAITYTVEETKILYNGTEVSKDIFTVTGDGTVDDGETSFDNTPKTTTVSVSKKWEGDVETDRPESIEYTLTATADSVTLTHEDLGLASADAMKAIGQKNGSPAYGAGWEDLPKYTKAGVKIDYTVTEGTVEHYSLVNTTNTEGDNTWTWEFTNKMVKVEVPGTKKMTGRILDGTDNDKYTFKIEPVTENAPAFVLGTVNNDTTSGEFKFGPLYITDSNISSLIDPEVEEDQTIDLVYKVTEDTTDQKENVKYDTTEYTVTIPVIYNKTTGAISAGDASFKIGDASANAIIFENTEITSFDFEKVWKKDGTVLTWPENVKSITVTLKREPKNGGAVQPETVTYTVTADNITGTGFEGSTSAFTGGDDRYKYSITGLPKYWENTGAKGEWKYTISETQVDGYNLPIYITLSETGETEVQHKSGTDGASIFVEAGSYGVKIENDLITVSLPETGGIGTTPYTVSGLLLLAFTALAFIFKKKRRFIFVPVDGESPWKGGGPLR